jgi:hypothetical protein
LVGADVVVDIVETSVDKRGFSNGNVGEELKGQKYQFLMGPLARMLFVNLPLPTFYFANLPFC